MGAHFHLACQVISIQAFRMIRKPPLCLIRCSVVASSIRAINTKLKTLVNFGWHVELYIFVGAQRLNQEDRTRMVLNGVTIMATKQELYCGSGKNG